MGHWAKPPVSPVMHLTPLSLIHASVFNLRLSFNSRPHARTLAVAPRYQAVVVLTQGEIGRPLLIMDNLQSTTGCPTVVEFWQGLRLDRDLDVEEQDDNPDKRFTQV
jgi:hypothetical protein